MSSVDAEQARSVYGGQTERETLLNMARETKCFRIYQYGTPPQKTYKLIQYNGDPQEAAMFQSPYCSNIILLYDNGQIVNRRCS